jgi:hypothetical protein
MATKQYQLAASVDQLEEALASPAAGDEKRWSTLVDRALAEVQEAAHQHAAELTTPGTLLVEVDRPLLPSPGVDRRAGALHDELEGFVQEVRALRQGLRGLMPICRNSTEVQEVGPTVDLGAVCRRARTLVRTLEHFEEEEAALILDSVNTDVGAGD